MITKAEMLAAFKNKRTCVKCGFTGDPKKFPIMATGKRDRTCRKCRLERRT